MDNPGAPGDVASDRWASPSATSLLLAEPCCLSMCHLLHWNLTGSAAFPRSRVCHLRAVVPSPKAHSPWCHVCSDTFILHISFLHFLAKRFCQSRWLCVFLCTSAWHTTFRGRAGFHHFVTGTCSKMMSELDRVVGRWRPGSDRPSEPMALMTDAKQCRDRPPSRVQLATRLTRGCTCASSTISSTTRSTSSMRR